MSNTKEILESTRHEIIASMLLTGANVPEIAAKLELHPSTIHKICKQTEFKEHLRDLAEKAVEDASNIWKSAMQERLPEALKLLDHLLKSKNPKALDVILKTLAIDKAGPTAASGNIQIVMPNLESKEPIDV